MVDGQVLELVILRPQLLDVIGRRLPPRVADQARFAGIQELFAPLAEIARYDVEVVW